MLPNEERHLIIQALNHRIPVKEIAECFSINTSTIYRLRKQMEMTGSVETLYLKVSDGSSGKLF